MKIFGLRGNQLGELDSLIDAWDVTGVEEYYRTHSLDDTVREQAVWKTAWSLTTQSHPLPIDAWEVWEVVSNQCERMSDVQCLKTFLMSSHPYHYITHDILARVRVTDEELAMGLEMALISKNKDTVQAFLDFFPQVPVLSALRSSIIWKQPDICMMLAAKCDDLTPSLCLACMTDQPEMAEQLAQLNKHSTKEVNAWVNALIEDGTHQRARDIWQSIQADSQHQVLTQSIPTLNNHDRTRAKL